MRPNSPLYCQGCRVRIPNRKDRKTHYCRKCLAKRRCSDCGQVTSPSKKHQCASVDLKGKRLCAVCRAPLRNIGYERWKTRCARCEKKRWRDKERDLRRSLKLSFGGRCSRCGYSRSQAALHFHHLKGRVKKTHRGSVTVQEVRDHPERFDLLCANCHIELHNPPV